MGNDPQKWAEKLRSKDDDNKRFNGDDQPVVGVTWFAAVAYSHWLTFQQFNGSTVSQFNGSTVYRLPTDEEWEWAAGGGVREYPWGKPEPGESRANYYQKVGQTTPVGAYPAGATPEGLMDMAGNVWEWMANRYDKDKVGRALRGGSWDYDSDYLRCSARLSNVPVNWGNYVGCRLVRSQSGF